MNRSFLSLSRRLAPLARIIACVVALTSPGAVHAAIRLSTTTFSTDNRPHIFADQADINAAQAAAGPGGYYKLRAKFLVSYDPGYFHGTDAVNNNGQQLTAIPSPGIYLLHLYWTAYNVYGELQDIGEPFHEYYVTINPSAAGGTGLRGEFFNGNQFNTLVRTAQSGEAPHYVWGDGGPPGTNTDNFSVRWRGFIEPLYSQLYTFTTGSDDGMRVFISNMSTPVAQAYYDHGYLEASGQISLTAGQRYEIQVDFFENSGGAEAKLFWQSANQQREIVPVTRMFPAGSPGTPQAPTITSHPSSQTASAGDTVTFTVVANGSPSPTYQWRKGQVAIGGANGSSLTLTNAQVSDSGNYDVVVSNSAGNITSPAANLAVSPTSGEGLGTGLRGSYYNGEDFGTLVSNRLDAVVDFEWGNGSPTSGMASDHFSVRWVGQVEIPATGNYIVSTYADDGVRLTINGVTLIDDWSAHPPTDQFSSQVYLTAGSRADIVLEFFESGGGAVAKLFWQPPGGSREIIPQSRLYSDAGNSGGWENILTESRTLYFTEETDGDGNGTGNWSTGYNTHTFTLSSPGRIRVYTTGAADTFATLYRSNVEIATAEQGGDGGNIAFERTVGAGTYTLYLGGHYQGHADENYTAYVDYRTTSIVPVINGPFTLSFAVGANLSHQVTSTPADGVTFEASNLPPGLAMSANGLISGMPYAGGNYDVTVTATNEAGSDTEVLAFTFYIVPPTCTISANTTSISPGQTVILTVSAHSSAGTIRDINIDQVSPNPGYYGVGNTGTEIPPGGESYRSPDASNHTRQLELRFDTPGTYRFRAAVSDITTWYHSPTDVTIHVGAANYVLTVNNGTGDGSYPAATAVSIAANSPPAGQVFSQWTRVSGTGTFASATAPNTTFNTGNSATTIQANYVAAPSAPTIVTPPGNQTVNAGQTASFQVSASGSGSLSYQWRRNGVALANGGRISGAQSTILVITATTTADAGFYDVVVTNATGNTTSNTATLVVNGATSDLRELIIHRP